MLDKELILRFLAFKMCHFNTYKEPMILFLNEIMKDLGEAKRVELDLLEKDFNRALALSWEIFGDDAFRKSILNKDKRGGVINRALFEVVTVVFSNLTEEGALDIKRNKEDFIKEYLKLLENNDFFESISISTTYAKNISYRFNAIINIVNIYLPEKEYQR
jgi:hypothetical protein